MGPRAVGFGSCIATAACSDASFALIDSESCNGDYACSQTTAEIGDHACNGPSACEQATGGIGDCANHLRVHHARWPTERELPRRRASAEDHAFTLPADSVPSRYGRIQRGPPWVGAMQGEERA